MSVGVGGIKCSRLVHLLMQSIDRSLGMYAEAPPDDDLFQAENAGVSAYLKGGECSRRA